MSVITDQLKNTIECAQANWGRKHLPLYVGINIFVNSWGNGVWQGLCRLWKWGPLVCRPPLSGVGTVGLRGHACSTLPRVGALRHYVWVQGSGGKPRGSPAGRAALLWAWGASVSTDSAGSAGDCCANCCGLAAADFTVDVDKTDRVWARAGLPYRP